MNRISPTATQRPRGFTLIELLIVVAIIAILAAIAVPNFLEAQTRAKVSRVKADMRTLATGIESYHVDNNSYPREWNTVQFGDPQINGQNIEALPGPPLSTPIAYLTSSILPDPFIAQQESPFLTDRYIFYYDTSYRSTVFWLAAQEYYGAWRMGSLGPDGRFFNSDTTDLAQMQYDPTNGTISPGNIWRSQKNDGVQPPIGTLLQAH